MFRFTIRDLLLITITVAMVCGWCEEHLRARGLAARLQDTELQVSKQTREIERLKKVNETTAAQWAKALSMLRTARP